MSDHEPGAGAEHDGGPSGTGTGGNAGPTTPSAADPARQLDQRVLVLAPFGHDGAAMCQMLDGADFEVARCGDVEQVCEQIQRGAAAALVAEEALSAEARGRIVATLADQPSWSDLPLLVLTSRPPEDCDGWRALRGFENTVQVRLLERPLSTAALVSTLRAVVQSRQKQYQVRDELAARRRAEAAVRRSEQLSAALNRINASIHAALDPDDILQAVLVEGTEALGCDSAAVSMRQAGQWTVRCIHGLPDDLLGATMSDTEERHALLGLQSLDPVAIHDAWNDERVDAAHMRQPNIRAVMVVPLTIRGSAVGVAFFTCHTGPRSFTEAEVDFVRQLAATTSVAMENVRLIDEHRQAEAKLTALNETLEAQVAERTAVAEQRAASLRRLAIELAEAEHRERKRLAQLLHHDLQQLLLAVKLRLPTLVEDSPGQLRQHVDKLDELVGECLSTSRSLTQELSPPVIEYGSVTKLIEWLGRWYEERHQLDVHIEVRGELPPAPEHLRVFLFDAVRELLCNVVKHSGTMEAKVRAVFAGGYFVIQVEDTGRSFDPATVEARLQQPEGFGLFNIRERLEALGGCLDIENGAGGGAIFRMTVPVAEGAGPAAAEQTCAQRSHGGPGVIRLLVVDDHQVVREGMVGLLNRQKDIDVVGEAADGLQAIEQAAALCPDAIIIDVDMPTMNGIEATRHIKHSSPHTVVLGLSLHEEEGVRRAMSEAGADGYISKHAPAKELVEAVRRLCREPG